jgi:hypothetical protein
MSQRVTATGDQRRRSLGTELGRRRHTPVPTRRPWRPMTCREEPSRHRPGRRAGAGTRMIMMPEDGPGHRRRSQCMQTSGTPQPHAGPAPSGSRAGNAQADRRPRRSPSDALQPGRPSRQDRVIEPHNDVGAGPRWRAQAQWAERADAGAPVTRRRLGGSTGTVAPRVAPAR